MQGKTEKAALTVPVAALIVVEKPDSYAAEIPRKDGADRAPVDVGFVANDRAVVRGKNQRGRRSGSPAMSACVLALEEVTRSYRDVHALRGVNLSIDEGELVSVVGPSGSGKFTMLNLIDTLDRPTSGMVSIAGRRVDDLDDDELSTLRADHIGLWDLAVADPWRRRPSAVFPRRSPVGVYVSSWRRGFRSVGVLQAGREGTVDANPFGEDVWERHLDGLFSVSRGL